MPIRKVVDPYFECLARFYFFGLANIMQSEAFFLFFEENDLSTAAAKSIDLCIWWCDIMSLSLWVTIATTTKKQVKQKGCDSAPSRPCWFGIHKKNIFHVNPIKMNEIVMPETAVTRIAGTLGISILLRFSDSPRVICWFGRFGVEYDCIVINWPIGHTNWPRRKTNNNQTHIHFVIVSKLRRWNIKLPNNYKPSALR